VLAQGLYLSQLLPSVCGVILIGKLSFLNQWRIQDLTLGGGVDFVNGGRGGIENLDPLVLTH